MDVQRTGRIFGWMFIGTSVTASRHGCFASADSGQLDRRPLRPW